MSVASSLQFSNPWSWLINLRTKKTILTKPFLTLLSTVYTASTPARILEICLSLKLKLLTRDLLFSFSPLLTHPSPFFYTELKHHLCVFASRTWWLALLTHHLSPSPDWSERDNHFGSGAWSIWGPVSCQLHSGHWGDEDGCAVGHSMNYSGQIW